MMIKIEAMVREEKFEDVKAALDEIGVNGLTVSQVMGVGIQRGYKEVVRGMQVDMQMQPKIKFEIWSLLRNGRRKPLMPYRKPLIPERPAMEKSSATRSKAHIRSVPKRQDMMRSRQVTDDGTEIG